MKTASGIVCIATFATVAALPFTLHAEKQGKEDALDAARDDFESKLTALAAEHARDVDEERAKYVERLTEIMEERTRAGDLDGALAARDAISFVRAEAEREAHAVKRRELALPEEIAPPPAGVVSLLRVVPLDKARRVFESGLAIQPAIGSIHATSHHDGLPAPLAVDRNLDTEWALLGVRGTLTVTYQQPVEARFLVVVTRTIDGVDAMHEGELVVNGRHTVPIADVLSNRAMFFDVSGVRIADLAYTSHGGNANPGVSEILFLR